jgi:hypothetical protein
LLAIAALAGHFNDLAPRLELCGLGGACQRLENRLAIDFRD